MNNDKEMFSYADPEQAVALLGSSSSLPGQVADGSTMPQHQRLHSSKAELPLPSMAMSDDSYGKKSSWLKYISVAFVTAAVLVLYNVFFKGGEIVAVDHHVQKVVAIIQSASGDGILGGTVTFQQAYRDGPVSVSGTIRGLPPSSTHGFHVHELGNLDNKCLAAGAHFNPFNVNHGDRSSDIRHVGDLGNIESGADGMATISFVDNVISLSGPKSIIGRSVVVHQDRDDLGKGGNEASHQNGNSGARIACGIVAIPSA